MKTDINHYVTKDRINNASFRQKLDPISKNILRRQNPLELFLRIFQHSMLKIQLSGYCQKSQMLEKSTLLVNLLKKHQDHQKWILPAEKDQKSSKIDQNQKMTMIILIYCLCHLHRDLHHQDLNLHNHHKDLHQHLHFFHHHQEDFQNHFNNLQHNLDLHHQLNQKILLAYHQHHHQHHYFHLVISFFWYHLHNQYHQNLDHLHQQHHHFQHWHLHLQIISIVLKHKH